MENSSAVNIQILYRRQTYRNILCIGSLVLLVVILACFSMTFGNTRYSLGEVISYLFSEETKGAAYTVKSLRLPKLIVGILSGFSFGLAGYTFQELLRNPLASPDIIGISAGSSAAAVFCILILGISGFGVSISAMAAGLFITGLIFLLSGKGGAFGTRMILIGIGMQAVLNALISWMLLAGSEYDVATALRWLRGSLNAAQMSDVPGAVLVTVPVSVVLLILHRYLRIMQLGDEYATTLGVPLSTVRILCVICALVLCSFATAKTGPIAAVAFLSGPIARRLCKNGSVSMAVSGLTGSILVLSAELMGKNLLPAKYPVGVVTGLLGAPYLLLLLLNLNKKGEKI